MPTQCKKCNGNDLLGLCTMRECSEERFVCFQCKDNHNDHATEIVQLKTFKTPQQIAIKLMQNTEVLKKYQNYEYDQSLDQNDNKIEQFREIFNNQKQKIIE